MKKLILPGLVAVMLGGAMPVLAQSDVPALIDQQIALMGGAGTTVTYSARDVSGNSVMFSNVVINSGSGQGQFMADWIRAEPSSVLPGDIMLTVSPTARFLGGANDPTTAYEVEISSQNLAISGNWIAALTPSPRGVITADSLRIRGLTDTNPYVEKLDISSEGLSISFDRQLDAATAEADVSIGSLAAAYILRPEGQENGRQEGDLSYADLLASFSAVGLTGAPFPQFVDDGGSFDVSFSSGLATGTAKIDSPEMTMDMSGSSASSASRASLQDGQMAISTRGDGISYDRIVIQSPQFAMPPFSADLSSVVVSMSGPLTATEAATDANLVYEFNGLSVSDALWSMIDPEAKLPRGPANLQIDLDAVLQLKETLVAMVGRVGPPPPPTAMADLQSLTVNRVLLELAGAAVSAQGAMTFDNQGPVPMPNGAVDVSIDGVQGLAENLVALGLVPQQQAMGMMGMMMMLAQPTDRPDSFTSKLEFQNGQILANGMALPF